MYNSCPDNLFLKRKFDIFKDYFKMAPQKIDIEVAKIIEIN
jgi:hypothetical protein